MRKLLLLAPLALLAAPLAAAPASADSIVIRHDNGLHRGWHHDRAFGRRRIVERRVYRHPEATGSVRTVKKVTRTNEFGDRVTKKTIRTED